MSTKYLIAVAALVAASTPAFAESPEYPVPDSGFVSTKTRAEVVMELRQAQDEGLLAFQEDSYPVLQQTGTARSRAEVRSEAIESRFTRAIDPRDIYFGG